VISSRCAAALTVVPLLLLGACATDDGGPTTADPSATTAATDDVDYPEEGLDLEDAPQLKGVYQKALQTYVDFERGRRLTAREGRVDRMLAFNATSDVVEPYREALKAYGGGGTYAGDVTVEFLDAQPHGDRLLIDVCIDATALEVPDGAPTQLGEATRALQHVEVTNIVGPWRVTSAEPVDGSC
jgi:hypothetical protein